MKERFFVLFLFILVLVANIEAQSEKGNRFSFLLSPQVSWMKSDYNSVDGNGNVFGFDFGILYDRFFDENYAFATGVVINSGGGKLSYNDTVAAYIGGDVVDVVDLDYKLRYLQVPLGLKLFTNDFRRTRFYGEMGLYMGFNIVAHDSDGKKLNDEVKFFDSGFQVGGGMDYSLGGTTYLTFGLHYFSGFTDVTSNSEVDDKTIMRRVEMRFGIVF